MTEEQKPEENKANEIKSLDESDCSPEDESPIDEKSTGFIGNLISIAKKFKLYLAIGFGMIIIAATVPIFLTGNDPDSTVSEETEVKSDSHLSGNADQYIDTSHAIESKTKRNDAHTAELTNNSGHTIEYDSPSESAHEPDSKKSKEPTLEEAIYEWSSEELMELARLKSAPKDTVEKDSSFLDGLDTALIIAELEEIFALPDVDEDVINMTPEDSIDTLNWIEEEYTKIKSERADLEKQRKELEKITLRANQALNRIGQIESDRIINLARLYDKMKPREVAKLFANLSDSVVIQIIPRMKPSNASKILTLLPTRRAANISKQLVSVLENK